MQIGLITAIPYAVASVAMVRPGMFVVAGFMVPAGMIVLLLGRVRGRLPTHPSTRSSDE